MKLISVTSRGDRLARVKLLDSRFFPSRSHLYRIEKRSLNSIIWISWNVRHFKHESSALKAAAEWLKGAK